MYCDPARPSLFIDPAASCVPFSGSVMIWPILAGGRGQWQKPCPSSDRRELIKLEALNMGVFAWRNLLTRPLRTVWL